MGGFYKPSSRSQQRMRRHWSITDVGFISIPGGIWDSSAKGANIVLSNGNMDATGGIGAFQTVYGTSGKASGKWQFEIIHISGISTARAIAGLADKTNSANLLATYCGNNGATVKESIGYWGNGTLYRNLTAGATNSAVTATAVNDVITIALDADLLTAKFYLNGVLKETTTLPSGKIWFPAASVNGSTCTARLRTNTLAYPVVGHSDWA